MALNFGLLNPNAPAEIAGAYGQGQQQALQTRQQEAATQGAEMNLSRLKQEHEALDKLMTDITANGGPSDPMQAADMMMQSKHPEWFKRGYEMKQSYIQLNNDRQAMGLPPLGGAPANALAPTEAAPANAMAAPAAAPAPAVNALAGNDVKIRQAKEMLLSSNPGIRAAGEQQLKMLTAPPVMHSVVPGATLVGPDGKPVYTAPERADTDLIRNYNAAKAQGFTGSLFDYESRIKAAGRSPAAAPTPAAPVAVMGPDGKPVYVSREQAMGMTPVSAAAAPEKLKPVPVHAQKAIQGAASSVGKLDDAINLLEGKIVGGQKGSAAATGLKAYAPDIALNRLDPKGTVTRAAIADIGSMIMHDRSGAAVTASESPRLKPFIPLITDDAGTALKKLKRLRQIQADDAEALAGTYTPEQGFKSFSVPTKGARAPAAPTIAPPAGFTPD